MATMTIRNLDARVKESIRLRAAKGGHSMEEEARRLLTLAVDIPSDQEIGLATAIRRRFEPLGKLELQRLPRGRMRTLPQFK
ncbi:MAG: FitA-like ribbon-helix-helix domain-containing protein [Rhodoplanes sp.]|jgi:antitoxin FitA